MVRPFNVKCTAVQSTIENQSAAYHAHSAVYGAISAAYSAISTAYSAISAGSCAEIPQGPIRKLASIWKSHIIIHNNDSYSGSNNIPPSRGVNKGF